MKTIQELIEEGIEIKSTCTRTEIIPIVRDHTQQTGDLVNEKIRNGMFVEVQLKSMHPDVIILLLIINILNM